VLRFIASELLLPNGSYDDTTQSRLDPLHSWGYSFNWTLREGRQTIEQHDYMIFRYLLRPIFVYQPKDLSRDWSPRFSTLRDKNGWIRAKTA
jgi:hypothetical protein